MDKTYKHNAGGGRPHTYMIDEAEIAKRQLERADEIYQREFHKILLTEKDNHQVIDAVHTLEDL